MLYIRMCFDKQGASALRKQYLTSHRQYIASFLNGAGGVKVLQGGPMCADDDCTGNIGSILIFETASLQEAQRFHDEDPFTRAELFDNAYVIRWDRHIGNPDQAEYKP